MNSGTFAASSDFAPPAAPRPQPPQPPAPKKKGKDDLWEMTSGDWSRDE